MTSTRNSNKNKNIVAECHIGGKAGQIESDWRTIRATFHNFESFPHQRGERVRSETMECHGIQWRVFVYPRGHRNTTGAKKVSVEVGCVTVEDEQETEVSAAFNIGIPSADLHRNNDTFFRFTPEEHTMVFEDLVNRSRVLDRTRNYLVKGALTVEIDIKVKQDQPKIWIPTNNVCTDMLKLLDSADFDNADALFYVGSDKNTGKMVGKRGPCLFYAHHNILSVRCPTLASWVDQSDPSTPVAIENVEPDTFQIVLRYVYGGELPDKDTLRKEAFAIIEAANFLCCTGLKLAAEAELTLAGIDIENAAQLILFADRTCCAMLKEAAMGYFLANSEGIVNSEGYKDVAESTKIMGEMLAAVTRGKKRPAPDTVGERDLKRLCVATLRQKLHRKGLDFDGSKETLMTRLEEQLNAEAAACVEAGTDAEAASTKEEEEVQDEEEDDGVQAD